MNKLKKLKQGQTVYRIDYGLWRNPIRAGIEKIAIASRKTPLPQLGCIIENWPVDFLQSAVDQYPNEFYFSRRKAEKQLRNILCSYES